MIRLAKWTLKRALPAGVWQRFRGHWWRYVRPLLADYCPLTLPWFPSARSDEPMARLHRLAMSFHWKGQRSVLTTCCVWLAALLWPFRLLWDGWQANRHYGRGVRQLHGLSRCRQAAQMLHLAWRHNVPPLSYYRYRLYEPQQAPRAANYIHADEMNILYPTLMVDLPSDWPLREKQQFFEGGRGHGLPVVGAIAAFDDGALQRWYGDQPGRLPACDLVLKPVDLACGRGFRLFPYDPASQNWRDGSRQVSADEFLPYCGQLAGERRHILQVRLVNHPQLVPLASAGLCTYRIVTYRRGGGEAGVLLACLRMPTGASPVDNFEAGGIAAGIDLETGLLGPAVAKDPTRGSFDAHPDTGAAIAGAAAPQFDEAVAVTLRAHACYPWVPFVGWDVVVTPEGPQLLEANPDWCVELAQIATGRPLGETLYPEIYLEQLADPQGEKAAAAVPCRAVSHVA